MVNGAGLAMATMDLIKLHGGEPANFLDVGGGATSERVTAAFELILPTRKYARYWSISSAASSAAIYRRGRHQRRQEVGVKVPVVVRLEGTNADKARAMLAAERTRDHAGRGSDRRGAQGRVRRWRRHGKVQGMSILVNKHTRVICQGFTGKQGPSTPSRRSPTAPSWSAA